MKNEEYERLLNPSPEEFLIWICEGIGHILYRVSQFNLTETICRILGHGFDPEGCRLPEWDYKPAAAESREILDVADTEGGEQVIGTFVINSNGELKYSTGAEVKSKVEPMVELTDAEWEEMKNYNPILLNRPLAKKLKYHWLNGASDKEAGILAGCSQSYARHHRLAFEKAAKKAISKQHH